MKLTLVRHARPHHVVDDPAGADPDLTDEGHEQARVLAAWFEQTGKRADAIVSSTMRRAQQTAAPLARALGLSVTTDERLVELDHGWSSYGMVFGAADERAAAFASLNAGVWGEESFDPAAFCARVVAGVEDQVAAHPDGNVVVVCHGGVISAYVAHVVGSPRTMLISPAYTSLTRVLALPDGHREILTINETPHVVRTPR